MGWIDFILNLAGLLLWFNWRSMGFAQSTPSAQNPLLRTLKRPEAVRSQRWLYFLGLMALMFFRPVVYGHLGSALSWTPHLQLNVLTLPFRSDLRDRMVCFSFLSFGLALFVLYAWLLLLSVLNRAETEADPLQKLVSLHLGRLDRWPTVIKLLLPTVVGGLLWVVLAPLLAKIGILPPSGSAARTWQQALVIGLAAPLAWKWLLIGLLLLHLLNSYVYLGESPLWRFVSLSARHVLKPLHSIPSRLGKVDLAPAFAMALILLAAEVGSRVLTELYAKLVS